MESLVMQAKAMSLQQHMNDPKWLTTIGLGEVEGKPCFFVYVNDRRSAYKANIPKDWHGVPVKIKYMGAMRLASS